MCGPFHMKILALEFSSNERSVAVALKEGGIVHILGAAREAHSRGVTSMSLIDRAMVLAKSTPSEISAVMVGLGPGSYTGIRSALAIAQGWQLGRDVQVSGVGSMSVLARAAEKNGLTGEIGFIIDAQRGDVYLQRYRIGGQEVHEIDALRILPIGEIPAGIVLAGPEAGKFRAGSRELNPGAETLATFYNSGQSGPAEQLEPIYLRQVTFVKAPASRKIE